MPIHYRITPTSISTCHALKYFLVLMFFLICRFIAKLLLPAFPHIMHQNISNLLCSFLMCLFIAKVQHSKLPQNCAVRVLPGSHGLCSASFSVSATSTSPNEDSSCSKESKFLAWFLYASLSPFLFSDSSRIWTTYPSSPRSFSASSSVSTTSSLQKKAHPGCINPIFLLQPPMLPLLSFCF